jgi:hypothetical protein
MLEIDGVPPRLANQFCEALICQQYWYQGRKVQEVDNLLIQVNGRWSQLYFDAGIVFWRLMPQAPAPIEPQAQELFAYPWIDVAEKYGLKDAMIRECQTEALVNGARVALEFDVLGSLLVTYSDNQTRLQFNPA